MKMREYPCSATYNNCWLLPTQIGQRSYFLNATIYLCYCIMNNIADRPLSDLCDRLTETAVRLLAACFGGSKRSTRLLNPIQCSIEVRTTAFSQTDPDPNDKVIQEMLSTKQFISSEEYLPVALFTAFVDYAIHMNFTTRQDWIDILPDVQHPFPLVQKCMKALGITPFPNDYSNSEVGNIVVLFMFCSIQKARGILLPTLSIPSKQFLDCSPAAFYIDLKNWRLGPKN